MQEDKIGIIIQARMGSTRLPGKILKKIGNKTLLEHIFYRLNILKHSVSIVLATSTSSNDDQVEEFCKNNGIEFFRGSESNVLERYYLCAGKYQFDHIIRLTGDNPFPDIEELDNLIDLHINTNSDYSNSFENLPVGAGAEIFTFRALEKSYYDGKQPHHLEHVDEYMLENPKLFKTSVLSVPCIKNRNDIRLTVDTLDDYDKAVYTVQNSKDEYIQITEAIKLSEIYEKGLCK